MKRFIIRALHALGVCYGTALISGSTIYSTCETCGQTDILETGGGNGYMENKAARAPGVY